MGWGRSWLKQGAVGVFREEAGSGRRAISRVPLPKVPITPLHARRAEDPDPAPRGAVSGPARLPRAALHGFEELPSRAARTRG